MPKIIHFYDKGKPFYEFTNFAICEIELKGKTWPTSEHYFQAQKHAGTPLEEQIRLVASPREAFTLGRSKTVRPDWLSIRNDVMREVVLAKFTQNKKLRDKLLSTGDATLVEHTAKDDYWGDGSDGDSTGSGQNMLGQILMSVRNELQQAA